MKIDIQKAGRNNEKLIRLGDLKVGDLFVCDVNVGTIQVSHNEIYKIHSMNFKGDFCCSNILGSKLKLFPHDIYVKKIDSLSIAYTVETEPVYMSIASFYFNDIVELKHSGDIVKIVDNVKLVDGPPLRNFLCRRCSDGVFIVCNKNDTLARNV